MVHKNNDGKKQIYFSFYDAFVLLDKPLKKFRFQRNYAERILTA